MLTDLAAVISLQELESLKLPAAQVQTQIDSAWALKEKTMREAALSLGARAGLKKRSGEILDQLQRLESQLDALFQFQSLVLEGGVVPPVISEIGQSVEILERSSARTIGQTYRIDTPARFTTTPPNWREYLVIGFSVSKEPLEMPAKVLLPKGGYEEQIWKFSVREGWGVGYEQANQIFQENLQRLERDFTGMVLYHHLYTHGLLSKVVVGEAKYGITGDLHRLMQIDEKMYRITSDSTFQMQPEQWKVFP